MGRRDAEPVEGEQQMVSEDSPQSPGELSVAGKVSEGASGVLEDGRPVRGQWEGALEDVVLAISSSTGGLATASAAELITQTGLVGCLPRALSRPAAQAAPECPGCP